MIFVGGLVTGTDAGMAVPDWPTTFGDNMFLYPLSKMVSGLLVWIPDDLATDLGQGILTKPIQEALNIDANILSPTSTVQVVEKDQAWKIHDPVANRFYTILRQEDRLGVYVHGVLFEHSHRLLGTLVGLLTIATTISIWIYNSVKQLKWVSALALLAVIIQGLLGGLRVIENSIALAIIHASFAPISLAFFTSLVLLTSKKWSQSPPTTDVSQIHRLVIFASEDIGLKDNHALPIAMSALETVKNIGLPEATYALSHVTIYLSLANKSRGITNAMNNASSFVKNSQHLPPPLHLINIHPEKTIDHNKTSNSNFPNQTGNKKLFFSDDEQP